jgi:Short C-terminal domain
MPFLHSKTGDVSARAQVGSEHDTGGAWGRMAVNPGGHGTPVHATLQMWVAPAGERPPDLRTVTLQNGETLFESHLSVWGGEIERMGAGRWTYVRYRADQPQRCEIDKDRLTQEFGELYGGKQRLLIPRETSDGWFAQPATTEPPAAPPAAAPEPSAAADAATVAEAPPEGLVAELAQLAQLRDAGSLSEAEFAAAKARLLGQSPPA